MRFKDIYLWFIPLDIAQVFRRTEESFRVNYDPTLDLITKSAFEEDVNFNINIVCGLLRFRTTSLDPIKSTYYFERVD